VAAAGAEGGAPAPTALRSTGAVFEALSAVRTSPIGSHLGVLAAHAVVVGVAIALAEVAVGLGIVISMFRNRDSVNLEDVSLLRW